MDEPAAGLRRELGLRDVTLFGIAAVIGIRWIPAAANAGPGAVTLWLLAAVFFCVPLAFAVGALSSKYPGAGGLYLWTRNDFGPWHGFLCFWIYWNGIAFWFPSAAMFYTSISTYAFGAEAARLADNRWFVMLAATAVIWLSLGTNLVGMRIGKWTENAGGAATWVLSAILIAMAVLVWMKRGSATTLDIRPAWNWDTVNFWSQIVYGVTGLEVAAMMGAEIRDPARTLPKAGWITAVFATLFYSACTAAILVILPAGGINVMHGLAQSGAEAGALIGAAWIPIAIAVLVVIGACGQFGALGTATSRLPYAAGVDQLLPKAFARIHPKWHTPHISILTLGVVATAFLLAIQLGDTMRAAYQTLVSLMVIAGMIPYFYIFGSAWKAGLRWSAAAGLAVSGLALVCTTIPTADVNNVWLYELKLAGGTLLVIGTGWLVYRKHQVKPALAG